MQNAPGNHTEVLCDCLWIMMIACFALGATGALCTPGSRMFSRLLFTLPTILTNSHIHPSHAQTSVCSFSRIFRLKPLPATGKDCGGGKRFCGLFQPPFYFRFFFPVFFGLWRLPRSRLGRGVYSTTTCSLGLMIIIVG